MTLTVLKNRHGSEGEAGMDFHRASLKFENWRVNASER